MLGDEAPVCLYRARDAREQSLAKLRHGDIEISEVGQAIGNTFLALITLLRKGMHEQLGRVRPLVRDDDGIFCGPIPNVDCYTD